MSTARRLRDRHAKTRAKCESHPFVLGMAHGSLPHDYFVRWVAQDWLYLQGYIEVLKQAARLASDDAVHERWMEMVRLTRDVELDLHRGLAREVGLDEAALDATIPYSATKQYLRTLEAASHSYETVVATLTPCAVGYAEIALVLGAMPRSPIPRYAAWIDAYLDPAFQQVPTWLEQELDRLPLTHIKHVERAYDAATRCELDFWDGLWTGA